MVMVVSHQSEPGVNNVMGNLLRGMMRRSTVRSEHTRIIMGYPSYQPDIVITASGRAPVVIEAEYLPGANVEEEAKSRLGLEVMEGSRTIEAVIALRYPVAIGDADDQRDALSKAVLSYCVFTEGEMEPERFPDKGWLEGTVEDIADMVRLVSVPQRAVDNAAESMEQGINRVARILDEAGRQLREHEYGDSSSAGDDQRSANATHGLRHHRKRHGFHERIAGMYDHIKP